MSAHVHAFDFLAKPGEYPIAAGVCALFGSEALLKREAVKTITNSVFGEDSDVPFTTLEGPQAEWRDVGDELSTASLFSSGPRLVIVDEADKFVSSFRDKLEAYAAAPAGGVLVLLVDTWPGNTRLAKAVAQNGLAIECRAPQVRRGKTNVLDEKRLRKWLIHWAKQRHGLKLEAAAAEELLDLVGPELGVLDSDLAKLALYVEPGGTATTQMVQDVIGGWRMKSIWQLVDAAAEGNAAEALAGINRLLQMGEAPQALFGQIAWSLRRYATATRIYQQAERGGRRMSLEAALEQAGFRRWQLKDAQKQLRQLGRHRAGALHRWLLETDLALKGSHSQPDRARLKLEQLLIRLAKQTRDISVC